MSGIAKIVVIVIAISLCVGGVFLATKDQNTQPNKSKTEIVPVRNAKSPANDWLRA
jgi:hypothetical protein